MTSSRDDLGRGAGTAAGRATRSDVAALTEALVDRAVLGVHRHDLCTRRSSRQLHHGRAGDEGLFVGKCQASARTERLDGHRKAGEPDDGVQDDVTDTRRGSTSASGPLITSVPAGTSDAKVPASEASTMPTTSGWKVLACSARSSTERVRAERDDPELPLAHAR